MAVVNQRLKPHGGNTMSAGIAGAIFRELDVCRSLFDSLAGRLENNAGVVDYHPLAVLAAEGKRKIDTVMDMVDRGVLA